MQGLPLNGLLRTYLTIKSHALLSHLRRVAMEIDRLAPQYAMQSASQLSERIADIRRLIGNGGTATTVEVPLFAILREIARRELGMFPYHEQLLAALALNRRKIIQMDTGEGKTLVCPFTAILDTFYWRRALVITANTYLSERDANWMAPLYRAAGVDVATVLPHYSRQERHLAYSALIVYVDSSQLVFDYSAAGGEPHPRRILPDSVSSRDHR